jgi:hypothetical protein
MPRGVEVTASGPRCPQGENFTVGWLRSTVASLEGAPDDAPLTLRLGGHCEDPEPDGWWFITEWTDPEGGGPIR